MDILPGFKLCRKRLHWYLPDQKGRGCSECGKLARKTSYHNNPEVRRKIIDAAINYEKNNKEKINAKRRERYQSDLNYKEEQRIKCNKKFRERWASNVEWRNKKLQKTKEWYSNNKEARIAYANKKKAKKLKALPCWADKKQIKNIYKQAAIKTKETGIKYHVDHIYPLRSPFLCGLHVETNLQVITAEENLKKEMCTGPVNLTVKKVRFTLDFLKS